jgi:hypothetical protein
MYDFFSWAATAYRVPVEGVDAVIMIMILVSDYFYLVHPVLVATAKRVYVAGM